MYTISIVLIVVGITISAAITIGIVRFGNNFTILHIISANDMLALPLILLGCCGILTSQAQYATAAKVLLLIILLYIANPISGYIMAKLLYFNKKTILDKSIIVKNPLTIQQEVVQ
jgi:multisubunit Na+/H+ antiporter MnhG subunit